MLNILEYYGPDKALSFVWSYDYLYVTTHLSRMSQTIYIYSVNTLHGYKFPLLEYLLPSVSYSPMIYL